MRYLEAGGQNLSFVSRDEYPVVDQRLRRAIDHHWTNIVLVNNPSSHIGINYCCNGIVDETPNRVTFGYNQTGYDTYNYARSHELELRGAYVAGDGTFIYLPDDDSYVFVERSGEVGFDGGKFALSSGGCLSVPQDRVVQDHDFLRYAQDHALEETLEELVVVGLLPSVFLGVYFDEKVSKLEFLFAAAAASCALNNNENTSIFTVPRGQVTSFFRDNPGRFEASTEQHLDHWAQRMDERPIIG